RTRHEGDVVALDPVEFFEGRLAELVDANGPAAGRPAARMGLPPLTFVVGDDVLSLVVVNGRVAARRGPVAEALVVALDDLTFSDLMQDVVSTFGAQMLGRVELRQGSLDTFVEWEPVLRNVLDGRAVYEPGTITLRDRAGAPLTLTRSFSVDDSPDEIGRYLAEAGYVHITGM